MCSLCIVIISGNLLSLEAKSRCTKDCLLIGMAQLASRLLALVMRHGRVDEAHRPSPASLWLGTVLLLYIPGSW